MNKRKIFNDPVYGFVTIPYEVVFDIVEHPYFQRLRRIRQLALGEYVYPGATHTRFQHALGALHLTTQAIETLRLKGVEITEAEAEGLSVAILLHDIGHGPFSHALEHTLVGVHHEDLSLLFMRRLNAYLGGGALDLAIQIFEDTYPKRFLHQLVSGQLDMDRMDYLNRDSFFSGVHEGVIGYDRIIKMLAVRNGELVVEYKGLYSIEKFLIARRLMYWQVYLHKTVISTEQMLIRFIRRAKEIVRNEKKGVLSEPLAYFLLDDVDISHFEQGDALHWFALLDDVDILSAIKQFSTHRDATLRFLAHSLLFRNVLKIDLNNRPIPSDFLDAMRQKVAAQMKTQDIILEYLVFIGETSNRAYHPTKDEIRVLTKEGEVLPLSVCMDNALSVDIVRKYYICYPKIIH